MATDKPHEEHMKLDEFYNTSDPFNKKDNEWEVKNICPFCEYCRRKHCDRKEFWDELAFEYSR